MKKLFLIFFASFAILFLSSGITKAEGLVPCGQGPSTIINPNYNPLLNEPTLYTPIYRIPYPNPAYNPNDPNSQQIIQNPDWRRCELKDLFTLALNVYNFIVLNIATPLAGLLIIIGGVLIIVSGGPGGKNPVTGVVSPNLYTTAKNMIKGAVIGIFLVYGSWLIINIVLTAIGYNPPFPWSSLPF